MSDEPMTAEPTPWWELSGMEREIAKYNQCEEPGDCDHDHDNALEYFREQELNGLRERAEKAEAEVEQLRADRDSAVGAWNAQQEIIQAERRRAERAEADAAEVRAYLADPFNRHRIAVAVRRAHRQRDEAVEAADAEVEEYRADLKATHEELARVRDVEAKLRAWLADKSPSPESADLIDAVLIASGRKLSNSEAVAILRAVLPMHETQHVVTMKQIGEQRTHFELEAFKLAEENAKLRAQLAGATTLLGHFVDHEDQPCRLDHHGACQEHGGSSLRPCDVAAGRELLARWRAEG